MFVVISENLTASELASTVRGQSLIVKWSKYVFICQVVLALTFHTRFLWPGTEWTSDGEDDFEGELGNSEDDDNGAPVRSDPNWQTRGGWDEHSSNTAANEAHSQELEEHHNCSKLSKAIENGGAGTEGNDGLEEERLQMVPVTTVPTANRHKHDNMMELADI
jgi:hypothetical protein